MAVTKASTLLRTQGLAIGYAGKTILDHLDLQLHAGTFVCFMGPNGIGKSTLIRTLAGLQQPLKGNVTTAQRPAVVLTDRVTAGYMTVRQLITFGRYLPRSRPPSTGALRRQARIGRGTNAQP